MQEWLNWPLSKSGMGKPIKGSNPFLSANKKQLGIYVWLFFINVIKFEPLMSRVRPASLRVARKNPIQTMFVIVIFWGRACVTESLSLRQN